MTQLPKINENIYPRNIENIKAILDFFLPSIKHGSNCYLNVMDSGLQINQIEYAAKMVQCHLDYLTSSLNSKYLFAGNLMKYAIDAIYVDQKDWKMSVKRQEITYGLKQLITNEL